MPTKVIHDKEVLALDGGKPCTCKVFSPWPFFDDSQVDKVRSVLTSGKVNYWTGVEGRAFESEFARYIGVVHGVAVANGTVALELALVSMGIGPGDEVIVTPRTFIASASAVVMRGATPIFADVDRVSQNITAETIAPLITKKTKAIITVHLAGWPCDMDPINDLARSHGIVVIEDCAQAHGASYNGNMAGSLGDIAAFSFCQDKIMSTGGEGGMLVMNDETAWKKAWSFKDHGKDYDVTCHASHPKGFRWLHEDFGTNWRLTEMQSALGRNQLEQLTDWLKIRRRNAKILENGFSNIRGLRVTKTPDNVQHAYYKYYVFVEPESMKSGWSRDRIMSSIEAEGVPCFSGSCSQIYLERAFGKHGLEPAEHLRVASELGDTSLMFLVHPTLSDECMNDTVLAVSKVMKCAVG